MGGVGLVHGRDALKADAPCRSKVLRHIRQVLGEGVVGVGFQVVVGFDGLDENATLSSAYFDMYFAEAVRVAEERNVPLYCGEYGVIDRANPEDAMRWYECISESFNKFHIGRAAWNYKEKDFGLIDEHMKDVKQQVVKLL